MNPAPHATATPSDASSLAALTALMVIVLRWLAALALSQFNRRHVRAHAGAVPEALKGRVDPATYSKSVAYTLAKNTLAQIEDTCGVAVLLVVLFSGVLPRAFGVFTARFAESAWAAAAFLFVVGLAFSVGGLPFDWYAQFRLEERFGFNTTTPKLWAADRLKGLLLAIALGYPLLVLVLKIIDWTGAWWWLWAWAAVMSFQLVMVVLAPVLILPLFNKFTPLPEGALRERLLALAERTGFRAKSIQLMDGSRRSRHSNAFFTGFGRFRKIVLFDTLVEQLTGPELEAVLAHEIGHYRHRHVPKMIAIGALGALAGFAAMAGLARAEWFPRAFGFDATQIAPALLLFALLSGSVAFWLSPLIHFWSRRYEYEADAYAASAVGGAESLIGALRKLNEKNLSNLTPHPAFSAFYYSHPTLLERERALTMEQTSA